MVNCQHAASGCDYPAGECSGACVTNNTQRQPAVPQYLTIVYQIHSPGQVQALLHATDWTAMSHSHAILDRDTAIKLRDALHAELNDVQDQRREAFRAIGRLNDELGQAREQRDALLESEHNLSDAYIRLREKLDAFDTPTGPKAEQVYAHTEAKLDQLIAQRDALLEALKEAEPFLALGIRKKARAAIAKAEGAT